MPDVVSQQVLSTLPSTATVREAVTMMAQRRIGAILVVEDDRLVGIFTERDAIVRVLAAERDPKTTPLSVVMTPDPDTLPPEAPAGDALNLMEARNYRHMPVVSEGKVVGMVSIRDLFAVNRRQLEMELRQRDDFIYGTSFSPETDAPDTGQ